EVRGPDGRDWAVKCFTRPAFGLETRYARVAEVLAWANLPFGIGFTFLSEGILVRGQWRPAVKMEWVEGVLLNEVVRENAARPGVLSALLQMWVKLCRRLRGLGIAHADLQHGNVILVPEPGSGRVGLKLIDYDGMYVPALADRPSGEAGHPNYQHPARAAERAYSADLDRFPHLVIGTALKALECCGPSLWGRYDNGDNLLFAVNGFRDPAGSALMRELWESGHPGVRALVGRLALACVSPLAETPWLDQVAPDGEPLPLDESTARQAHAVLVPPFTVVAPGEVAPVPEVVEAELVAVAPRVSDVGARAERDTEARPRRSDIRERERDDRDDRKDQDEEKKSRAILVGVAIAVGLLLLCGLPIGGVLIFAKKKPAETTQTTKPGDTAPGPDGPNPKNPIVVPPLVSGGSALDLQPRWSVRIPTLGGAIAIPSIDTATETVFCGSTNIRGFNALDLRTGAFRPGFLGLNSSAVVGIFPLEGGRVGTHVRDDLEVRIWDAKTGQPVSKIQVPLIPTGTSPAGDLMVSLSPNARYLGVARNGPPSGVNPEGSFQLFDLVGRRNMHAHLWRGGSAHFTADSSRLLVASFSGQFHWFDLPDRRSETAWGFGPQGGGIQHQVGGISGDGRVIGYLGR